MSAELAISPFLCLFTSGAKLDKKIEIHDPIRGLALGESAARS